VHLLAKILPLVLALAVIVYAADFDRAANCSFAVSHFVRLSLEYVSGIQGVLEK
jgi:hypothetical protein